MFASTKIIKRTLCEDIWRCSDFLIQSQYSASLWDSVFFYSILPKSELLIIQHIDCYVADFQNNPFTKTISLKWAIWKLIALTCVFWSLFRFVTFVSFGRVGVRYKEIGLILVYTNSVAITFMSSYCRN